MKKKSIGLRVFLFLLLFSILIYWTKPAKAEESDSCSSTKTIDWIHLNLSIIIQNNFSVGEVVQYRLNIPRKSARPDFQCQMLIKFWHKNEEMELDLFYTPGNPHVRFMPIQNI